MALGKRKRQQQEAWVATCDLPQSPGHPFYEKLNGLLGEAKFDDYVEELCRPYYADGVGRPGIPPGVYFRMLLVGYFEGLSSQRAIAWRCSDSRSLQRFLGYSITDPTPEHSSLTVIRQRLPLTLHEQVFGEVLRIAQDKKLLHGKSTAVDSTLIEAEAAMKSIVRRDSGDDWKEYVRKLAAEEGIENPTDEELRKSDRKRKGKKVSNNEWFNPNDPDARIAKMKDGRTHLAYKTEHAVDLKSDLALAAGVYHADESDTQTLPHTLTMAQANLILAGSDEEIKDAVADKGYHSNENVTWCQSFGIRTYIRERESRHGRRWTDKPEDQKAAVYGNRRRVRGKRGKALGRLRSEYTERSFAHTCETGGARRIRLRGLIDVTKRYLMYVATRNLGVIMRALFGTGTPKSLQTEGEASPCAVFAWPEVVCTDLLRLYGVLVLCLTQGPRRVGVTSTTRAA
ncbi:MAG: transposase [Phycisphaerales bacterium]|nr:MAG: transposase [Phycisphaerales bacterium]